LFLLLNNSGCLVSDDSCPLQKEKFPTSAADYEKIEQIGRGMMNNTVWKAKTIGKNDEMVAIKIIDLATFNTQALDSIKKEIQIMYWANHPNIVEFYSAFIDGSKLWLVMKMLEGSLMRNRFICSTTDSYAHRVGIGCAEVVQTQWF
jgi:serine/threonine protein kinase